MCRRLLFSRFSAVFFTLFLVNSAFAQTDSAEVVKLLGHHTDDAEVVCLSFNNKYIATGGWDNTVQVFKTDSNFTHIQSLDGHRSAVSAVAFNRNASVMVTGGKDYKLLVWKADTGLGGFKLSQEINSVHSAGITSVILDPAGKVIFSSSDDGKILIYGLTRNTTKIIDNKIPIKSIVLNGTRRYIYCADESAVIKQYDIGGNLFKSFEGHKDVVNSLAFSPNNQYFVSGSSDKTAIVWNAVNGKQKFVLAGHAWKVTSVAISADSKYIITGSSDGTVKLWDANDGTLIRSFDGHGKNVRSVAMSRDLTQIYAALHLNASDEDNVSFGGIVFNSGIVIEVPNRKQVGKVPPHIQRRMDAEKAKNRVNGARSNAGTNKAKPKPISNEANDPNVKVIKETDDMIITEEEKD